MTEVRRNRKRQNNDSFRCYSLGELAEMQGVLPAYDLDQIGALWPVDDDPDQLLAHIRKERAERRSVVKIQGRG